MEQVVGVMFVGIGFTLKGNIAISASRHRQAYEPLNEVKEIEADDEHLQHLRCVDALMLDEIRSNGGAFSAKQYSADVDGIVFTEWQQSVMNNFHLYS